MPEPRVEQVQHGVLDPADVEVHSPAGLAGHPVPLDGRIDESGVVGRVEVAQVVPARPGPLGHRVGLAPVAARAVAEVDGDVDPALGAGEGRFGWRGGVVVGDDDRLERLELGELDRQRRVRQRQREAVVVVDDRERLAPVALPAEEPVPQLVRDGAGTEAVGLEPFDDLGLGVVDVEPVEEPAVDRGPVTEEGLPVEVRGGLDGADDRQSELDRELPVALILARDRHDGAGAVPHEHVVGDEDRDRVPGERVPGVRAGEHAGLLASGGLTLEIGACRDERAVGADRGARCDVGAEDAPPRRGDFPLFLADGRARPVGRDDRVDEGMLGCEHEVGGAVDRVGAGGEDLDVEVGVSVDGEADRRAGAAPDPVPLHDLDRVGPVEQVEVGEEPVGVAGDAKHPLLEGPFEHGMVAPFAAPVGGDLLVGQDRPERRAPVDQRFFPVREPVRVDNEASGPVVELGPGSLIGVRAAARCSSPGLEGGDELGDGAGPVGVDVVPGVEDLQEDPLRPPVVGHVGGGDTATGVVPETQRAELAAHRGDVLLGRDLRMLAGLERVLLGGEPERVVAHRVEHVAARHPVEASEDVGADVPERVPDVEAGPARVREHVEGVELRTARDPVEALGQAPDRVRGPEGPVLVPVVLPLRLELVRQPRVVAMLRRLDSGGRFAHDRASVRRPDRPVRKQPFTATGDGDGSVFRCSTSPLVT